VAVSLQKLAVKRMAELICGIPVKRIYKPENERQKEVATFIEKIYQRNRIDSLNIDRCNPLFASWEVMTLWYAVQEANSLYGKTSKLKLRCRNFSQMQGNRLYPLFDEYGDMVALSVSYEHNHANRQTKYFDTYTKAEHVKYKAEDGATWQEVERETIATGKIPAVYTHRPTPIWEQTSTSVNEIEWALSRNGNYLRQNSKPLFVVFADEQINYGDERDPNAEFRSVMQYPKGSTAQYITWQQAVENLKFFTNELRSLFFTQLQLPDWSYDKMSQQALSGESRKQMFIDAQLKVKDESGRLLEFFDRETNVIKSFAKIAMGEAYAADIDALEVETIITPFTITDEKDTITNLMTANGGVPIISQREAIEQLGWSDDVDRTITEITEQNKQDAFDLTE